MQISKLGSTVTFKREFKLVRQRWKACTWGWDEGQLEILFAKSAEHFMQLIPSQVGVYSQVGGQIGDCGQHSCQRHFWAKIHTSCELVRLGQAKRDSGYPTRLQIKEGAQHNVEIVYCNCEIPLRLGGGLHALSGELVRLLPDKQIQRQRQWLPDTIANKRRCAAQCRNCLLQLQNSSMGGKRLTSFQQQIGENYARQIEIAVTLHDCK